jgi:hypothetical protein
MTRTRIAVGAVALVLVLAVVLLALATGDRVPQEGTTASSTAASAPAPETLPAAATYEGFLYGRIVTVEGSIYEGRLRFGGIQEAFWGDYFNGTNDENPWVEEAPRDRLREVREPIRIFGIRIGQRETVDRERFFMARFGDLARIELRGIRDVQVTLKSGTVFHLDRFDAGDFDDDLRVWDTKRGEVDLESLRIRTIELLPNPLPGAAPYRLHGTVRTRQGEFTGFVQWDREECVGTDLLNGYTAEGELALRFDTIRSIARGPDGGTEVTLLDGREIVLSGRQAWRYTSDVGDGNRGIYVDDRRYGRVLVSWDAFERVDFSPGGSGPAYDDFPPGRPLTGSVTTRSGQRFAGRLVYDLDESETTETLDAPFLGVDYTIPFGLVASIAIPAGEPRDGERERASVRLHNGEELQLGRAGDLGEQNAGMLIFVEGQERPEYVRWIDVARVEFERPPAMYPPPGDR